jgi:hypothetical protein
VVGFVVVGVVVVGVSVVGASFTGAPASARGRVHASTLRQPTNLLSKSDDEKEIRKIKYK